MEFIAAGAPAKWEYSAKVEEKSNNNDSEMIQERLKWFNKAGGLSGRKINSKLLHKLFEVTIQLLRAPIISSYFFNLMKVV